LITPIKYPGIYEKRYIGPGNIFAFKRSMRLLKHFVSYMIHVFATFS